MAVASQDIRRTGFAATERRDAWWVAPAVQGLLLATLICYANWAAFQGRNYEVGGYLSPLYSPLITVSWFPFSPAFLPFVAPPFVAFWEGAGAGSAGRSALSGSCSPLSG